MGRRAERAVARGAVRARCGRGAGARCGRGAGAVQARRGAGAQCRRGGSGSGRAWAVLCATRRACVKGVCVASSRGGAAHGGDDATMLVEVAAAHGE
eukprot:6746050-Prymnesium_polylepis.1